MSGSEDSVMCPYKREHENLMKEYGNYVKEWEQRMQMLRTKCPHTIVREIRPRDALPTSMSFYRCESCQLVTSSLPFKTLNILPPE
jgi:hypothetical protein